MAQTAWSIQNVPDSIAMKMAGLSSPQMRQRYTNIKPRHVSEFMSRLENGNRNGEHKASPEQTGSAK